jgi:hypothetical protein
MCSLTAFLSWPRLSIARKPFCGLKNGFCNKKLYFGKKKRPHWPKDTLLAQKMCFFGQILRSEEKFQKFYEISYFSVDFVGGSDIKWLHRKR